MLKLVIKYIAFIFLAIPLIALAKPASDQTPNFQEGKDYQVIQRSSNEFVSPHIGNVQVIEFFSYGCPACNHFEPDLEKWLATKPANVDFQRVHATFEQGWDVLAQAYYTAKSLGVEKKVTPLIFDAIHNKGQDLSNEANLAAIFAKVGVSKDDFESAFHFSPGIDAQMLRGQNLMDQDHVTEIPTLVIDGRYKTNLRDVQGNTKRLLQIVDFLIRKEQQGN